MTKSLTIGLLARKAGIRADTVRFYERIKLIEAPTRTTTNYRTYSDEDVARLKFIKVAKDLGFSLSEIRDLLTLRQDSTASKADVKQRVESKIATVREKIGNLRHILSSLERLSATCDGHGPIEECEILKALDETAATVHRPHGDH